MGLLLGHETEWKGSVQLHTLMEAVATFLALTVGVMALVRFYSKKDNTFLFVGTGFIGTAFLDGYHAIVTSSIFAQFLPSDLSSLIPWSWIASRLFLSISLYLSWLAWKREDRLGSVGKIPEKLVYLGSGILTLASFLFFAFVPLPRAYYPEFFLHRPEEIVPALLFLLALIGYLRQGKWRKNFFEHWLVLTLIVSFLSQAIFMSHSGQLFDFEFDIAHLLKKISYIFVLTGLTINMYILFRRAEESGERIRAVVDNIIDAIITINEKGIIQSANPAAERVFEFSTQELIGMNVRELAAEPYQSEHDGYIANYILSGIPKIIGKPREVEGRKKSGATFPMDLTVTELRFNNERLFLGIVRDISDRKQAEVLKNEFVSTVSHELRTPLTSIRGSLGMIMSGALKDPGKIAKMVELASKNTSRLINLVNDLLDMEKLQSGKMDFTLEEIDLHSLLEKTVEFNLPMAAEFGVNIQVADAGEKAPVHGDGDRLVQVVTNLLSNAIKFSPKGGWVDVSLTEHGNGFRVTIADQGPGIPEEFRKRVFERFSQADSSDTRKAEGTGLGLSISKAIVEFHGGQIGFETAAGKGSKFYFDLPEFAVTEMGVERSSRDIGDGKPCVLHVENDADLCEMIKTMIGEEIEYVFTPSVAGARSWLSKRSFSLVILDPGLPDGNGLDLIPLIKNAHGRSTPLVIFSSETFGQEVVAQADFTLLKTRTSNEELLNVIKSLTAQDANEPFRNASPTTD